ncbi:hypothetical protein FALCPG4_014537 [Fusarium falciforme]
MLVNCSKDYLPRRNNGFLVCFETLPASCSKILIKPMPERKHPQSLTLLISSFNLRTICHVLMIDAVITVFAKLLRRRVMQPRPSPRCEPTHLVCSSNTFSAPPPPRQPANYLFARLF